MLRAVPEIAAAAAENEKALSSKQSRKWAWARGERERERGSRDWPILRPKFWPKSNGKMSDFGISSDDLFWMKGVLWTKIALSVNFWSILTQRAICSMVYKKHPLVFFEILL